MQAIADSVGKSQGHDVICCDRDIGALLFLQSLLCSVSDQDLSSIAIGLQRLTISRLLSHRDRATRYIAGRSSPPHVGPAKISTLSLRSSHIEWRRKTTWSSITATFGVIS